MCRTNTDIYKCSFPPPPPRPLSTGMPFQTFFSGILEHLKRESLKKRRRDSRLILLYKGLKGKASIPTDDLIPMVRRCRNDHSMAYQVPIANTDIYKCTPTRLGIEMHFQTLSSPLLKVPRMVLLSSLLCWELGTNLPGHGPGEWLSFWRVTSKHFWFWLPPLLKVPRMVLLNSLLRWELGTNLPGHGPGEWLSFWRVTSKHFWFWLSPLLKVPRMVLLNSLLWWELWTSLPGHGPGEWLSFWRVTSKTILILIQRPRIDDVGLYKLILMYNSHFWKQGRHRRGIPNCLEQRVWLNVCTAPHHTALGKIQYRTNGNYRTLPSTFPFLPSFVIDEDRIIKFF